MKCIDVQSKLAFYADGYSDESESNRIKAHLDVCPLCRQHYAELLEVHGGLQHLRRPEISAALRNTIKQTVHSELQNPQTAWMPFSPDVREWLLMRFMPYAVGAFASLVIGTTFLTLLYSGALSPTRVPMSSDSSMMVAGNRSPLEDYDVVISPSDYARSRLDFASESPSINPQGTLIAMTTSLAHSGRKGDEVVVVADVYGNGSAQIAEVVEPSRNRHAVDELARALDTESASAPFVPATMENRPDNVRVVLKVQTVDVKTDLKRRRL